MHKIIFDTFEFDLTPYKISTVEDNYWFSDRFFTKYSFPFNFKLTEDLIEIFGDLLDDNAKFIETTYNVVYVLGNQMESSIFEIESQIGEEVKSTFRFGFDEIPDFKKKLAELPLHQEVITDIYLHAKNIISQTWPAVNYNYPQIYTDKYKDDNSLIFLTGKINNYVLGSFLENIATPSLVINRNIIQPLPYLLHVLKVGFEDAGYTLKGDILTSALAQKMLLFADIDYFDLYKFETINSSLTHYNPTPSYQDLGFGGVYFWNKDFQLEKSSKFHLVATVTFAAGHSTYGYTFSYKGTTIIERYSNASESGTLGLIHDEIDITFYTDSDADLSLQVLDFVLKSSTLQNEPKILEFSLKRVLESDEEYPTELRIKEEVKLQNVVPDVTFGDLVTQLRKYLNLNIIVDGKDFYLNFIEDEVNYNNSVNLSNYEVLKPKRTFNENLSYLLQFQDVDSPITPEIYNSVYVNRNQMLLNESLVDEETITVPISIVPLPHKTDNGIPSSFNLEGGKEKMYLVLYDGLNGAINTTDYPTELLLQSIYLNYHKDWFNFLLNSINYNWLFKMYLEELNTINKKVFAYGRYHVIKSIEKTQISEDLFEVEIETETLP